MNTSPTAPATRRGLRDWLVDALLFLVAVGAWLLVIGGRLEASASLQPEWLFGVDAVVGALGCLGLWLRRRWPVGLALVLIALSTFSESVAGAMVVALFTVAIHRPPRTTGLVFACSLVAPLVYVVLRPEPGTAPVLLFLLGVVVQGSAVGWGLFIHYRRQLIVSLRDRAVRAETEAQLQAEQAQQRAREEIAREMHDVLGHRLSLLSVHAGALEFRPDASAVVHSTSASAWLGPCQYPSCQGLPSSCAGWFRRGAPPMTRWPTPRSTRGKCTQMTDKKVWLVTGAGRGMGVDIAKAALAAGHAVVATARNPDTPSPRPWARTRTSWR
jgi:Histidine kinase